MALPLELSRNGGPRGLDSVPASVAVVACIVGGEPSRTRGDLTARFLIAKPFDGLVFASKASPVSSRCRVVALSGGDKLAREPLYASLQEVFKTHFLAPELKGFVSPHPDITGRGWLYSSLGFHVIVLITSVTNNESAGWGSAAVAASGSPWDGGSSEEHCRHG